jgi:hypothetical protein
MGIALDLACKFQVPSVTVQISFLPRAPTKKPSHAALLLEQNDEWAAERGRHMTLQPWRPDSSASLPVITTAARGCCTTLRATRSKSAAACGVKLLQETSILSIFTPNFLYPVR